MYNSNIEIYNASAGSGKTYSLVKNYLKLLIKEKSNSFFKNILALTFTNKAVNEMKERVLKYLKGFANSTKFELDEHMLKDICNELNLTENEVKDKSKDILNNILHNYGAFEISTIDKFNSKLIRTFAQDLKLNSSFEVELDTKYFLEKTVNELISKTGKDKYITKVILKFCLDKIEDDKSWNIEKDLYIIAESLIKENNIQEIEKLINVSEKDFNVLNEKFNSRIEENISEITSEAKTILDLIKVKQIDPKSFSRETLPNHFKKILKKDFKVKFDAEWCKKVTELQPLYTKKSNKNDQLEIDEIKNRIKDAFVKTKKLIIETEILKTFVFSLTPLSLVNEINKCLKELKDENNLILISDFNSLINSEIKNQPIPYLYERLGEKFKHFFIDEFQDTSQLQWNNLVPLITNALSEDYDGSQSSLTIVGDAKQAIYRWRGGYANQFIDLYNNKTPFTTNINPIQLKNNFRSYSTIIEFNNSLFNFIGEKHITNNEYQELYKSSSQSIVNNNEGYIEILFSEKEKDDLEEEFKEKTLEVITQAKKRGYSEIDICIITRRKKEGEILSEYLAEKGIKVSSSETLLIKNSEKIKFITTIKRLLIEPENKKLRLEAINFLYNYNSEEKNQHKLIQRLLKCTISNFCEELLNETFESITSKKILDTTNLIISALNLEKETNKYLNFYRDFVIEFENKNESNLFNFINEWDLKKEKLSLSIKESDAVNVMTIHKSKGLEFPIVIFPYATQNIHDLSKEKCWFPTNSESIKNININVKERMKDFSPEGECIYNENLESVELDNINLIYVTLTRAEKELYILSQKVKKTKKEGISSKTENILTSFLSECYKWNDQENLFKTGSLTKIVKKQDKEHSENLKNIRQLKATNYDLKTHTSVEENKAKEEGIKLHKILSFINTKEDVNYAIEKALKTDLIAPQESVSIKTKISEIVNNPELENYYNNILKSYNEKEIIINSNNSIIPDRIVFHSENKVSIIDYKTGKKDPKHIQQITEYGDELEKLNLLVKDKIIIYTKNQQIHKI